MGEMVEGRGGRRTGKKDRDGDDKRQGVPAQPWPGLQRQYYSSHPWKQASIRVPQGSAENRLKGLLLDVHASHRAALAREAE